MLYLVSLGLGDAEDITVKGLKAVRSCEKIFLESYTSVLTVGKEKLEELYGKPIIIADREMCESDAQKILDSARTSNVAFLVVGDVFCATTHSDLVMRAHEQKIPYSVIHNASIMNACGSCGLQLYTFGQAVSIPFFTETWRPDSFYEKIQVNRKAGFHTLCLLDIKVKEPTLESLARGKKVYEPPRFMTVTQAIEQLLEVEERKQEHAYGPDTMAVGLARIGTDTQLIVSGTLSQLKDVDFGPPLHSLVIAGELHPMELEMLNTFKLSK
eukprot:TRINITY_DN7579_c0_g1_i1.p1 TRINITY_DN7579_c0_g1~~TRINITY_DN7579_c0_g1_i1.p1  ORF type:complete len:270 (-),score=68.78 TRINITY_DN7579_c0_g1_i1:2-811(-)